jgi:phenylpyruvate tautomerase PptA (4-oxalocrotonate tautomerase family)
MLKQLTLFSAAFAASAFAPTQRLVGRAFGASSQGYKHAGRFVAMPTLAVQSAATPRSGAEELCKKLSSTVAGTLGKPESYVMVTFQKVDAMCYAVRKSTSELASRSYGDNVSWGA